MCVCGGGKSEAILVWNRVNMVFSSKYICIVHNYIRLGLQETGVDCVRTKEHTNLLNA